MTRPLRYSFFGLLAASILVAHVAQAQERQDGEDPADAENRAEAPERPRDMPLAELPEPPGYELKEPRPRALEAIDRLLSEIISEDPVLRERAYQSLLEAKQDWVSGIARRIDRIAERTERPALARLLDRAREKTRERMRREGDAKAETPDYLEIVLEHPDPEDQAWRDLTQVLALSRMLAAIGTTDAVREIIRIYVRFGDFLRIDCQKQLEDLGDRSIAGLIETQRHPAPAVAEWATTRLRFLDKLSPHDAVRTEDKVALADILVALGRNGDPESTRLLISFAGTERSEIRKAARQGITLLGEVAAWQLRDAYLDTTGRTPPRDWTWKRTARELFTEFDRLRLERVYLIFAEAKKAAEAKDWQKMREGYDKVLALVPQFERREEMIPGYRSYAEEIAEKDPKAALLALRRAERLDDDEASKNRTESQRLLLEAKLLRDKGIIDQSLLRRAKKLDPSRAEEALALATPGTGVSPWGKSSRYLVAGVITLIAFLGAGWIFFGTLRRRGGQWTRDGEKREPKQAPPAGKAPATESEDNLTSSEPASPTETSGAELPSPTDSPAEGDVAPPTLPGAGLTEAGAPSGPAVTPTPSGEPSASPNEESETRETTKAQSTGPNSAMSPHAEAESMSPDPTNVESTSSASPLQIDPKAARSSEV